MSDNVSSVLTAMISADVPRTSTTVHRLTDALLRSGWELTTSVTSDKVPLMSNADILNRIDNPTLCTAIMSQDRNGVTVFCEDEEFNPFTDRCAAHG